MLLFGRCKGCASREDVERLQAELVRVESVLRQFQTEQVTMHDQVRRWMRRAVAAERAVDRNQEPAVGTNGQATPASAAPAEPSLSRISLRGARARIAARRRIEAETAWLRHVSEQTPALPGAETTLPESHPSTEGE